MVQYRRISTRILGEGREAAMKHPFFSAALVLVAASLTGCGSQKEPLSRVMLTALAQPAVFEIALDAEYSVREVSFKRKIENLALAGARDDCWALIGTS